MFSKAQIDQLIDGQSGDIREFDTDIPVFSMRLPISIQLVEPAKGVRPKTVEILNDLVRLGPRQKQKIRELLYKDAMYYRENVAFGDPTAPKIPLKKTFWERITGAHQSFEFIAIDLADPRHPCNFQGGAEGVDTKVTYESFELIEDDSCAHRLCYLHCRPEWEVEHGRRIVIRNGEPVALSEEPEMLDDYDKI